MEALKRFIATVGEFLAGFSQDGQELRLLSSFWRRSIQLIGPPGCGKSDLLLNMLWSLADTNAGIVVYDLAGTLYDQYLLAVAHQAQDLRRSALTPEEGDRLARAHVASHVFVAPGKPNQTVGIDILRPVTFPDGTREDYQDVADRVIDGFGFDDLELRVRFQKYGKQVLILLSAGSRPITEYIRVLHGEPDYLQFLLAAIEANGASNDLNVARALHILSSLWNSTKFHFESNRDSTESAMLPFDDKHVGPLFSRGNVDLGDVVFGGRRLVVNPSSSPRSSFILKMLHAQVVNLALHRDQTMAPLLLFADELAWVDHGDLAGSIELFRNKAVSYVLSRQLFSAHFKEPRTADLIDGSVGTSIDFRQRDERAMRRLLPTLQTYDPDGAWVLRPVVSESDAVGSNAAVQHQRSTRHATPPASPPRSTHHFGPDGTPTGASITDPTLPQPTVQDIAGVGDSAGSSRTRTTAVVYQEHRIPVSEQKEVALDTLQRLPNHAAVLSTDAASTIITTIQAPQSPPFLGRLDLRAWLHETQASVVGPPVTRHDPPPPPRFRLPQPPPPPKPKGRPPVEHHHPKPSGAGQNKHGGRN